MGVFDFFSSSKPAHDVPVEEKEESHAQPSVPVAAETDDGTRNKDETTDAAQPNSGADSPVESKAPEKVTNSQPAGRFPQLSFGLKRTHEKKDSQSVLSAAKEHEKKVAASDARAKRLIHVFKPSSTKRAKESAIALRSLIIGPSTTPKAEPAVAKPKLDKIRAQLSQPKTANNIIAQLRTLPASEHTHEEHNGHPEGPIHAVCLAHTEAEEEQLYLAKIAEETEEPEPKAAGLPVIASVPLEKLQTLYTDLRIVDLVRQPADLGLGQPGNGKGILAGAVPTAETVIKGFQQITPQLMALAYATGRSITPNHAGVHPPTDRLSVLTYWWGLEILLPPPTLEYLGNNVSVANTLVNFLTALALVNDGAREILPFVRYIAQFIDFEFDAIKKQDKGEGVVCASTWIMPAALVPRPWDFPTALAATKDEGSGEVPGSSAVPPPLDAPIDAVQPTDPVVTAPIIVA